MGSRGGDRVNRRVSWSTVGISIALVFAACSSESNGATTVPTTGETLSALTTTTPPTTSSTTARPNSTTTAASNPPTTIAPPGTDPVAVQTILESLIDRYDLAVSAILADPRVAADSGHQAVVAYLDLFAPDSTFPETALQFWAGEGTQGHFYRPGPRGQMYVSTVQSVQVDSPNQATFLVCSLKSMVIVDGSGNELSAEGGQSAGSVVAVRVSGTWLLRDLTRSSAADCPDPRSQP